MKTRAIVLILVLSMGLTTHCDKIEDLLVFTISDQTTLMIESTSLLDLPINVPTPDVTTNSSQEFENNNTKAELVKEIKLEQLKLTITDPVTKTFSFLKSIHIYISSGQNDEIELASMDNVESSANTITLTPTSQLLDKYVKASGYKIRTSIVTREALTQDLEVRADLKFKVKAEGL